MRDARASLGDSGLASQLEGGPRVERDKANVEDSLSSLTSGMWSLDSRLAEAPCVSNRWMNVSAASLKTSSEHDKIRSALSN